MDTQQSAHSQTRCNVYAQMPMYAKWSINYHLFENRMRNKIMCRFLSSISKNVFAYQLKVSCSCSGHSTHCDLSCIWSALLCAYCATVNVMELLFPIWKRATPILSASRFFPRRFRTEYGSTSRTHSRDPMSLISHPWTDKSFSHFTFSLATCYALSFADFCLLSSRLSSMHSKWCLMANNENRFYVTAHAKSMLVQCTPVATQSALVRAKWIVTACSRADA